MPTESFGQNAVFGVAIESTYGTVVSPTKFMEIMPGGCTMALSQKVTPRPTQNGVRQRYYNLGKRAVAGAIKAYMPYQGAELLVYLATGGTVTSTLIASGVYKNVFGLGDVLPSGTLYWSPDYSALGTAYSYDGCQAKSLTITQNLENFLEIEVQFEGHEETKVASSAPTYPTFNGVSWEQVSTATVGGTTYTCSMTEFKLENDIADNRFKLGSRLKVGGGRKGVRKISGKLKFEFDNVALYDLFRNFTESAIVCKWTGGIAGGSTPYEIGITIPRAVFTGSAPKVSGPGPIEIEMPFEAFYDGTQDEFQIYISNLLTSIP